MKNAILLHGGQSTPDMYWFPSIRDFLIQKGYEVWAPELPMADKPTLKNWLPFVLRNGFFNENTILIGHSLGSALALSVLESIDVKINKAIFVAGFATVRKNMKPSDETMLKDSYDWERIKANAEEFIFINSDNDAWGCDEEQGRYLQKHLGGTFILQKGEGHFGSEQYNQPYKRFELLEKLLP